ncbi:hypothetical protein M1116_04260 [Patescibacteria group bacterium]|nr:hypothetical protein [Patescibacteria group bacterium]
MKSLLLILVLLFSFTIPVSAQGMMGWFNNPSSPETVSGTAQDEAKGRQIFDDLQAKKTTCQQLTDDDYDALGDYYMGQMAGSTQAHDLMNNRMTQMMGDSGEKQMHIALGKRLSGCNLQAPFPAQYSGVGPMMGFGGMMGNWTNTYGNGMMNYLNNWGYTLGWLPMLLFWVPLAILALLLIRWLVNRPLVSKRQK